MAVEASAVCLVAAGSAMQGEAVSAGKVRKARFGKSRQSRQGRLGMEGTARQCNARQSRIVTARRG